MSCSSAIAPLTCADGVSHPITALGCCGTETPTITQYAAAPAPFFVVDTQRIGSIRYNPVVVAPPSNGDTTFVGIIIPDDGVVISPYDVLGFPPFDNAGFVLSSPNRQEFVVPPPVGEPDPSRTRHSEVNLQNGW